MAGKWIWPALPPLLMSRYVSRYVWHGVAEDVIDVVVIAKIVCVASSRLSGISAKRDPHCVVCLDA